MNFRIISIMIIMNMIIMIIILTNNIIGFHARS